MGAGFVVFVLIARLLGSEALGNFALIMAFILIAGTIADMGTMAALAKDLVLEKNKQPDIYFGNYLMLRFMLAMLAILTAAPLIIFIKPSLIHMVLISAVAVPFVGGRFLETVYQVYERPEYTIFSSLFLAVTQLGIALPLLLWIGVDLQGYLIGFVLTQALYFVFSMYLASRLLLPRFEFKRNIIQRLIILAAPMGLFSVFNAVSSRLDIFMLSLWRSSEEMGLYNAAYRLLDLAIIVAATASVPLVPVLSRLLKEQRENACIICKRLIEITVVALMPVPFILYFIAEELVLMLYGQEFLAAVPVLRLFSLLFVCFSCMYIASAVNLAADNIHHSWWSAAIAALLNFVANYYLIPIYGILGAAFATVFSTLFITLVSFYFLNKSLHGAFDCKRWMSILVMLLTLSVTAYLLQSYSAIVLITSILCIYCLLIYLFKLIPVELIKSNVTSAD